MTTVSAGRPVGELAGLPADPETLDYKVSRLDIPALHAAWTELFGRPPPKGISRRLLRYAAAYLMQAKLHGGLRPAVRRALLAFGTSRNAPVRKPPLSPGSRLVREWQGRSHTVEVTEGGFLYEGRRYRSLSEVARAITGARWSGPRFFGL